MATTPPNRLRELREAADESREQLAVDFDVVKETVVNWETNGIPSWHLHALAGRYGVTISHLLRDERDGTNGDEVAA